MCMMLTGVGVDPQETFPLRNGAQFWQDPKDTSTMLKQNDNGADPLESQVDKYLDKSGYGRHVNEETESRNATLTDDSGRQVLDWASADRMTIDEGTAIGEFGTFFLVWEGDVAITAAVDNGDFLRMDNANDASVKSGPGTSVLTDELLWVSATQLTISERSGWTETAGTVDNTNYHTVCIYFDSGTSSYKVILDGVEKPTSTSTHAIMDFVNASITVFGNNFDGRTGDMMIYNDVLSETLRDEQIAHLQAKYDTYDVADIYAAYSALQFDASVESSFDKTGTVITQWDDNVGSGNDAAQGTPSARPAYDDDGLNGLPTVYGDTGDALVIPDSTDLNYTQFNIFVVMQRDDDNLTQGIAEKWGTFAGGNAEWALYINTSEQFALGISDDGTSGSATTAVNGTNSIGQPYLIEATFDGTNGALSIDDNTPVLTAANAGIFNGPSNMNLLGAFNVPGNLKISEFIFVPDKLPEHEREMVVKELQSKWSL